ncbi:MAG: hypothetical protein LBT25_13730 [Candidatus Symbiothrix sp.]|nr:hypothetical protein [Candidatus Symbiothrix sp.]
MTDLCLEKHDVKNRQKTSLSRHFNHAISLYNIDLSNIEFTPAKKAQLTDSKAARGSRYRQIIFNCLLPAFVLIQFLANISIVSAIENIVVKNETFESQVAYANNSYGNLTFEKCVFSNNFVIGQNDRINAIELVSCEFQGTVYIFNNSSITSIKLQDCKFNGAVNIINNNNIARNVSIQNCTIAFSGNNISNNHIYGFFQFTNNKITSDIKFALNMIEQQVSIKNNVLGRNFTFDLNTLNSIAVFTENEYQEAVFNASFFNGMTVFSNEIINKSMGFIDDYFSLKTVFVNLNKTSVDSYSSLNFEKCSFIGELRIDNVSNGIKLYNLYSNEYDTFNIDINLLKKHLNNIFITTVSSGKVVDVNFIEDIRNELDKTRLEKYDRFLSFMVNNYKRLDMPQSAAKIKELDIFNKFDAKEPLMKHLYYILYFGTFGYFTNYYNALLFAVIVIFVFSILYLLKGFGRKKPADKKIKPNFALIKKNIFISINIFFNLPFGKNEPGNKKISVFQALLGVYFMLSIPLIIGRLLG